VAEVHGLPDRILGDELVDDRGESRIENDGQRELPSREVTLAHRDIPAVFIATRLRWLRRSGYDQGNRRSTDEATHDVETSAQRVRLGRKHEMAEETSNLASPYSAAPDRYDVMAYRRVGSSGLHLPAISLGLWQNFGDDRALATQRAIVRRAFDRGVTHFDLANNYGPPYGSAETNFGQILRSDLRNHRDELVVSTKAGYDMWPGPYGDHGSRKYLLASLDQSLGRMGLGYVDIFYSHRFDPDTRLEETMGALDTAVRQGKALYVGISSYSAKRTREAAAILRALGTPLLIHQPSYSMLNRWIEAELLDVLAEERIGAIAFSPLAQGLLTDRYLAGVPEGSRAAGGGSFKRDLLTDANLANVRGLNEIAQGRGQTLAQMALAWTVRDPRVASALVGASSVAQLDDDLAALEHLAFEPAELAEIDRFAVEGDVNLWAPSSNA
jgi:L-glyceraldehyde 3-phosphate reductase